MRQTSPRPRIWPRSQPRPVGSKAASMRRSMISTARSAASTRPAANWSRTVAAVSSSESVAGWAAFQIRWHPAQEAAVAVLIAQAPGELVHGQGSDLERRQAQTQRRLDVGAGEVGHLLEQSRPGQLQEGALLLQCGTPLDATLVAGLGQQPQLGPHPGLQLGVDEANSATRSAMRAASRGSVLSRVRSSNSRARASTKDWTMR